MDRLREEIKKIIESGWTTKRIANLNADKIVIEEKSLDQLLTLIQSEVAKAEMNLLLKLKQVPPIDWLDANTSIDQWINELKAKENV